MKKPNNPKTQRCGKCGTRVGGKWWMQVGHNVFCIEHFRQAIKSYKKRK